MNRLRAASLAGLLVGATQTTRAAASECYDHYNPQAWDGEGLAIVLCRNNSVEGLPSFIHSCELRHHGGATIEDLHRHGLDYGRMIFTDYHTTGDAFAFDLDVVCQDEGGTSHTFFVGNGSQASTGCCRNIQCGSVACCGTDCSTGSGGAGGSTIPEVDAGTPTGDAACAPLRSREYDDPTATLDEELGSTVRLAFHVDLVPSPAGLSYAELGMRLYDADHPGEEGTVHVNGQGPLLLPASAAWGDTNADATLAVPVGYLQSGTNLIEFGVGTRARTVYGVSALALTVVGPICEPTADGGVGGWGPAEPGQGGVAGAGATGAGATTAPGGGYAGSGVGAASAASSGPPTTAGAPGGCGCSAAPRHASWSLAWALVVPVAAFARTRRPRAS